MSTADLYEATGRRPSASINFVTAHDGFTLHDLVSYNEKHNEANGEDNRDGESHNRSWNCGVEGPTDDPAIQELRCRQMRNFWATLMVSQGTPMLSHGDEVGRTQLGNNNAYCQDSELSWMDWSLVEKNADQLAFARKVSRLRRKHPVFRRRRFLKGRPVRSGADAHDIVWLTPAGQEMTGQDWDNDFGKSIAVFLNGEALHAPDRRGERLVDDSFLLCFNAHDQEVIFVMPDGDYANQWTVELDTTSPTGTSERVVDHGDEVALPGRSVVILRKTL
jgi:glycogen operon protein